MKKIWLGGFGACSNHQEKFMLKNYATNHGLKETEKIEEADIIIVSDTCLGTYNYYLSSLLWITDVLKLAKKGAQVIVSGCLAKGVKFGEHPVHQEILSKVTMVKSEELVPYVTQLITNVTNVDAFDIPYSIRGGSIEVTPVSGCLNHCSFCKTHYMNFDLKSYPFEKVESLARDIDEFDYDFARISMQGSNISLYGVDLYGRPRAHELIKSLTAPLKIKYAYVGALINWYQELVDEIINNPKVKEIFISIESGSERVYKLMNRPISFEDLIRLIRFIRKERPDIVIQTEFIAGYPTETFDDLKKSIDLAYDLDVYPTCIWPYMDSKQIPSSKLPGHSFAYCQEAQYYAEEKLAPLRTKYRNIYKNGELYVLEKDDESGLYLTMQVDGNEQAIHFEQLDRKYEPGEIILSNTVKSRKLVKRQTGQK